MRSKIEISAIIASLGTLFLMTLVDTIVNYLSKSQFKVFRISVLIRKICFVVLLLSSTLMDSSELAEQSKVYNSYSQPSVRLNLFLVRVITAVGRT